MTGRILIAEGVPTNRIVLRVKLTSAYYDVLQAGSGAEALLTVRRQKPDLVIAASDLPDMAGRDFCARLRAMPDASETPVILVHPEPDRAERMRALAAGADDVIARPLDELVLLARLRSLLRARHAEDELRLRDDTRRALGLAEPPAGLQVPARIAVVPVQADIPVRAGIAALRTRLPDRFETLRPDQALRDDGPLPEVFVIVDTGSAPGAGLSLLTQLRASPSFRQSAIVYVTRPDCRREAASALDLGANDLLAGGFDPEELVLRLPKQIARKRTADRLRANMRHGLRAAVTDPLTGLYNRRYALPHLARLSERAAAQRRPYALLLADLDHFKRINDTHGHAAGDAVLVELARRMTENLRVADLVARIGGEEFLVAMPDTDEAAAQRTAERLCRVIAETPFALPGPGNRSARITLSIGVALPRPGISETPDTLLDRADRALYMAKDAGRNRIALAPLDPPSGSSDDCPPRAISSARP
ncbi:diguanylate cyclase [Salipiger sp. P9]|uniref:diguanylate cyclase n=1 Tax=Salipiger pentaromativorans TaxID=2943193 RepID=UPI002156FF17|nr:diguanylate cyclase [Salipiger pentaromativorans]MCR8546816.1 diguanylate cyclase [Salipiger pentaromativorans]